MLLSIISTFQHVGIAKMQDMILKTMLEFALHVFHFFKHDYLGLANLGLTSVKFFSHAE